jgi:SAM-dependent methyltransferase
MLRGNNIYYLKLQRTPVISAHPRPSGAGKGASPEPHTTMDASSQNRQITKSYYETTYYSDVNRLSEKFQDRLHFYRLKKILAIHTPSSRDTVVDLGSAWGELCFALAPRCRIMIGVDFSEKVVGFCERIRKEKNCPNMHFMCADAQDTGLKSGSIDVAISADLFEHLYPDQFSRSLDECARILKPGGKLIVWTPHRGHIIERLKNNNILLRRDPAHVDYKSMEVLKTQLRKRNFGILKSYYAQSHLPVFSALEKALLPVIPLLRRRIAILAEKPPDQPSRQAQ